MSRYLRASNGCKASYPIILYYFMIASKEFTWTDISVAAFLYRRFPSTFLSTMFCNLCYCSISCVSSTATGFRAVWPFWPLRPQTVLFKYKFAVDQSEFNWLYENYCDSPWWYEQNKLTLAWFNVACLCSQSCSITFFPTMGSLLNHYPFWCFDSSVTRLRTLRPFTIRRPHAINYWFSVDLIQYSSCITTVIRCSLKDLYLYLIPGQGLLLQDSVNVSFPEQSNPPSNATWPIFRRAIRFPTPQDLEQSVQLSHSDHSQLTKERKIIIFISHSQHDRNLV